MFAVHCPRHQARVLLGPRCIQSIVNTEDGVIVAWRCRCGEHGTLVTGRPNGMAGTGRQPHTEPVAPAA